MSPAAIDITQLAFAPLLTTAKGAKQLPALLTNGDPVAWQPDDYMEVPFEPSAFGDPEAIRVTLCFNPSESLCSQIAEVDAWCISTLIANPSLIGISLTPEQVRERYSSSLKTSDKGYTTLRVKMNKSGRYALQCYDPNRESRPHPEAWRGCTIRPRLVFKGLWIMGKDFGSILECTHALVQEGQDTSCPF